MKDAVCSAVFQSLVRRVDDKRATMVVRYYIRGGLGRAGLRGWPSVEESLVGDVAIVWCLASFCWKQGGPIFDQKKWLEIWAPLTPPKVVSIGIGALSLSVGTSMR